MKTNVIAVAGIGLLVLFAAGFASIFEIRLASAQVDATSSPSIDTPLSTTTPDSDVAATSTIAEVVATSPFISPYHCMTARFCEALCRRFVECAPPWRQETREAVVFFRAAGAAKNWSRWAWG